VEFVARKDGHGREIRGIGQGLVDAFSTRTRQDIEGRLPELIEAYRRQFGREPDARALYGLRHRATLDTRRGKETELPALASAEPPSAFREEEPTAETLGLTPKTVADPIPEVIRDVSEASRRKQEEIDRIRSMPEPPEDDEELSPGEAWRRIIGREREDVWQPSREPMPAAPEIADREAER
jgi:hypothetical protein